MFTAFKKAIRQYFNRWLDRRVPLQKSIKLNQRNIFIIPSAQGRWFVAVLLVMLIAAINYQNNIMFALVFLLASVFIVTILHTFANLSGLNISAVNAAPIFCGDSAEFKILLSRQGSAAYFDINLSWPDSKMGLLSLLNNANDSVPLQLKISQRGWYAPPRLLVETFYPLGLLRCWSWLALDINVLVYPQPKSCLLPTTESIALTAEGELTSVEGGDEFYGFKSYQAGDSLKHVFWKGYAKGQPLQTKQFAAYRDQRLWLNFDDFGGNTEQRLSYLCYWVLQLEQSEKDYGLRLNHLSIEPSHGGQHQQKILKALALYGKEGSQ